MGGEKVLQKMVINKIVELIAKQFKLYDIMKYVKEPNDADERIDALEAKVHSLEKLILKKDKEIT